MDVVEFPFRFHPAFAVAARPFGVCSESAVVRLRGDDLSVDFGRWHVRTPLANVRAATVTGGYSWPKVIGPARMSMKDRGLTFATNPDEGVCISFDEPVRGGDPMGFMRHPSLTVTVADPAALAELLDWSAHDDSRTHTPDEPSVEDLLDEARDDLRSMTAAELRDRARQRGIAAVSRKSKAELVELLDPDPSD